MKYRYLASYGHLSEESIQRWFEDQVRKAKESGEAVDLLELAREARRLLKKAKEEGHG